MPPIEPMLNKVGRRLVTTRAALVYAARHRFAMQKRSCLLFGLQRSGTNYVQSLINNAFPEIRFVNTDLSRQHPLHKHARLYADKSRIPTKQYMIDVTLYHADELWALCEKKDMKADAVIVVVRHPFHWLRSYQRWAKQCSWLQPDHHYISEWTLFYGLWKKLETMSKKIVLVKYESLLRGSPSALQTCAYAINLQPRVSTSYHKTFVAHSNIFDKTKMNENLSPLSLLDFPLDDQDAIRADLDIGLVTALGYEIAGEMTSTQEASERPADGAIA